VTAPDPSVPAPAVPLVTGGLFVSFEGGDGSGKSTQSGLLGEWLTGLGLTVVLTREPGGTELGRVLRREVLHGGHLDARTEALIYAADRAHHVASLVRPALAAGSVVVTDRYLDSSVAYQGSGRDLGADEVEQLSLWATGGLLPAVTVLLDLDPVAGMARLRDRPDQPDRLESAGDDFHRRTREAFLARAAADPGRWLVLDASRGVDDVAADVRARVAPLLGVDAGAAR
jgi:dTMP kinase